jgi:hypothetical protein
LVYIILPSLAFNLIDIPLGSVYGSKNPADTNSSIEVAVEPLTV